MIILLQIVYFYHMNIMETFVVIWMFFYSPIDRAKTKSQTTGPVIVMILFLPGVQS